MRLELTSLDILYLCLGIGFLIFVSFFIFLVIKLSRTLDSLKILIEDVDDAANDIKEIKNKVKGKFFSAASLILGLLLSKKSG